MTGTQQTPHLSRDLGPPHPNPEPGAETGAETGEDECVSRTWVLPRRGQRGRFLGGTKTSSVWTPTTYSRGSDDTGSWCPVRRRCADHTSAGTKTSGPQTVVPGRPGEGRLPEPPLRRGPTRDRRAPSPSGTEGGRRAVGDGGGVCRQEGDTGLEENITPVVSIT